jgi:hypothetical protein
MSGIAAIFFFGWLVKLDNKDRDLYNQAAIRDGIVKKL